MIKSVKRVLRQSRVAAKENGGSTISYALRCTAARMRGYTISEFFSVPLYHGIPENYLRHRDYHRAERLLNPRSFGPIGFSKWVQAGFFAAHGIPQPRTYGYFNRERAHIDGCRVAPNAAAICGALSKLPLPLMIKTPLAKKQAIDVLLSVDTERAMVTLEREGERSMAEMLAGQYGSKSGVLLQEILTQHRALACFPDALNTLRIITHIGPDGTPSPVVTFLKLARTGSRIDNLFAGSLAAHVDPITGHLEKGFKGSGPQAFTHHPDTGAEIEGFEVPLFREACELAIRAHNLLPVGSLLGWDVAITNEGPKILEVNSYMAMWASQKMNRGIAAGPLGAHVRQLLAEPRLARTR